MSYTKKFKELTQEEKYDLESYEMDGLSFNASEDIEFYRQNIVEYTSKEFQYVYCSELDYTNGGNLYSIISFNDKFYNELYSNLKEEGEAYELSIQDTDYNDYDGDSYDNFLENTIITVYCPNDTFETRFYILKELAANGTSDWINDEVFAELFDASGNVERSQEVMQDIVKVIGELFDKCRDEYLNKLSPVISDYESTIDDLNEGYGDAWDELLNSYFADAIITYDDDGEIESVERY